MQTKPGRASPRQSFVKSVCRRPAVEAACVPPALACRLGTTKRLRTQFRDNPHQLKAAEIRGLFLIADGVKFESSNLRAKIRTYWLSSCDELGPTQVSRPPRSRAAFLPSPKARPLVQATSRPATHAFATALAEPPQDERPGADVVFIGTRFRLQTAAAAFDPSRTYQFRAGAVQAIQPGVLAA